MFIAKDRILISISLLFIYIFILTQIMQYLYIPKTNCEKNRGESVAYEQKRSVNAGFEARAGESWTGSLLSDDQICLTKNPVVGAKAASPHLATRGETSSQSISIANTFQSLKGLIVKAKHESCKNIDSVISWLACTLEEVKTVSNLAGYRIRSLLPEPYAAFATQFMFGKQSQTSKELYQLFKVTGMLDLLVISGFHLQITASLCYASIAKIMSKRQASIFVIFCIWMFMLMLPHSIPVERAVLATTVALTAKMLNRAYNPKLTLIAIALCMAARDLAVLGSLSFQLSFLASAVILWVYPIISGESSKIEEFRQGSLLSMLVESSLLSLVVTLSFAPLLSYYFGYLSLVSLIISPIFSLFLPFIFVVIWILSLFPFEGVWLGLGILLAGTLKGLLEGLFYLMDVGSKIELLSFNYKIESIWPLIGWYFAIAGFVAVNHYKSQKRLKNQVKMQNAYV